MAIGLVTSLFGDLLERVDEFGLVPLLDAGPGGLNARDDAFRSAAVVKELRLTIGLNGGIFLYTCFNHHLSSTSTWLYRDINHHNYINLHVLFGDTRHNVFHAM